MIKDQIGQFVNQSIGLSVGSRGRNIRVMLLAAGEGSRLRPITNNMPKPMVSVAGKPILQHNIEMLAKYGLCEIAVNLHHCPEAVTKHFGDGSRFGVQISYSYEPELLGTAGAVKSRESFFQNTFIVIYGDNLLKCDLADLLAFHCRYRATGTVALHYREDAWHCGVVTLGEDSRIMQFVEKPPQSEIPSHWVSAGVLILEPEILAEIPQGRPSDFGREILPALLKRGKKLYGYRLKENEGPWWIDTPADLVRVQNIFDRTLSV